MTTESKDIVLIIQPFKGPLIINHVMSSSMKVVILINLSIDATTFKTKRIFKTNISLHMNTESFNAS